MTTKKRDDLLVGLLLIVAIALGLGGTIWIARGGLSSGYPLYARFPWGVGVKPGQPVMLAGVQVGFVDHVDLIPDGTLGIALRIQDRYRVPAGTTATVEANGIFGDMLVALRPQQGVTGTIAPGDTVPAGAASPGMAVLLGKGDSIASNVTALTSELRTRFVDDGGMRDVRRAIGDVTKLLAQLSAVTAEQSRQLTATQQQLRKTLASVDSAAVDSTVASLQAATREFAALAKELQVTNTKVQGVVDQVASGTGTAGRLMKDPAVYARLDSLLAHLDSLAIDLKANPRKYINLKIF